MLQHWRDLTSLRGFMFLRGYEVYLGNDKMVQYFIEKGIMPYCSS
jgi:hypothetical protein